MDNSVILCGNLGGDPNVRYSQNGLAIANFSIAINRKKGEEVKTIWVYVRTFDKVAENVGNNLAKGSKVLLKGRLEVDEWEIGEGENKEKKSFTYVIANRVRFLDKKKAV